MAPPLAKYPLQPGNVFTRVKERNRKSCFAVDRTNIRYSWRLGCAGLYLNEKSFFFYFGVKFPIIRKHFLGSLSSPATKRRIFLSFSCSSFWSISQSIKRKPFRENSSHFSIVRVIYTNLIWLLFVAQELDANNKRQRKTRQLKLFLQQATLKTSPQINVLLPESAESSLLLNSFLTLSRYEIKITNNCREGSLMLRQRKCAKCVTWGGQGIFFLLFSNIQQISTLK